MISHKNLVGLSLVFIASLVVSVPAGGATPDWIIRWASPDSAKDEAADVATDAAGNTYVVGSSGFSQLNTWDMITIKYAPNGDELWLSRFDGPASNQDLGMRITVDHDGDVIVIGRSEGDILVVKYDPADGSEIWVRKHNAGGIDQPNAVTTDPAGNIYVGGQSWTDNQNDFYTLKLDSNGNVLWTKRYNGPGAFLFAHDQVYDIAVDGNGDVFVTGPSNSAGTASEDYVTIKYRGTDGQQLWFDRYAGVGVNDIATALVLDDAGDLYVTGGSYQSGWRYATIKYRNSDGERLWVAIDSPAACSIARDIVLDSVGDVYVTGSADPDCDESNFNDDIVTIKHRAADGAPLWSSSYGSPAVGKFDVPSEMVIDSDDNVFVTGQNSGLLILLQYDPATGEQVDVTTYDSGPIEIAGGSGIALDPDQNVLITGIARNVNTENRDFLTMKFPTQVQAAAGDANRDGVVDIDDIFAVLAAWGPCGACPEDVNSDGVVNIDDIFDVLSNWY